MSTLASLVACGAGGVSLPLAQQGTGLDAQAKEIGGATNQGVACPLGGHTIKLENPTPDLFYLRRMYKGTTYYSSSSQWQHLSFFYSF